AKITADRNDPAIFALVEDDAVAPVRAAAGDDDGKFAVEVGRPAPVHPRGVADADSDPFFLGPRIAKTLQPGRARGAAPGGIDHEICFDGLLGAVADPEANAGDGGFAVVGDQPLHGAAFDGADI